MISCLTSSQYKAAVNFLVSVFCQKDMKVFFSFQVTWLSFRTYMQLFSYTMDVLYPQGLQRIIMDMFGVDNEKVLVIVIMFIATSLL